ncbi:hypothetical protein ENBRE01_2605 [Enteropsectra breve]|nr:hypothetical protein ENBRE01_2605 [Enteropsectra breve]
MSSPHNINGDNAKEILDAMGKLSMKILGNYTFKKYDGDRSGGKGEAFLEQFMPYENSWSEEEKLAHVECNLEGKAKSWFRGACGKYFTGYEDLKKEFREMFCDKQRSEIGIILEKVRKTKLVKGKVEEGLLEFFEVQQTIIPLKEILSIICTDIPKDWAKRLTELRSWKEVLHAAKLLDETYKESAQAVYTVKKPSSDTFVKKENKSSPNGKMAPRDGCYICGGAHYASKCPKRQNKSENNNTKLFTVKVETSDLRPRFNLYHKEKQIVTLCDTGADASFIRESLMRTLGLHAEPSNAKVKLAKGECISTEHTRIRISTEDGRFSENLELISIPELEEEMILGTRAMKQLGMSDLLNPSEIGIFNEEKVAKVCQLSFHPVYEPKIQEVTYESATFGQNVELNKQIHEIMRSLPITSTERKAIDIEHEIELTANSDGVYLRPYRRSYKENEIIAEEVKKMLGKRLIRESDSPFASPVVLVKKKNGEVRFCVDYRKLNQQTVQKPFPIPHMDELLETVGTAEWFTGLDLESGYHQIRIREIDIPKTAFITRDGHYEWLKMPFGLINAPYTFQRIMTRLFKEYLWKFVVIYLDDVLIFSNTEEEHIQHVKLVLNKLSEFGLRLNFAKCTFGVQEIDFLGFKVKKGLMSIQESQKKRILDIIMPKNKSELRSVLGLFVFFRRFIPGFAVKAAPLFKKIGTEQFDMQPSDYKIIKDLKEEVTSANCLMLPQLKKPFKLYTDASGFGIGGVLTQVLEEEERVVAWISRKLSAAELNYSTTEKECLAIVWSVQKLRVYLWQEFEIYCDHQALKWLLTLKEPKDRLARWVMVLQQYKYSIKYVKGKENAIADALSRGIMKSQDGEFSLKTLNQVEESLSQEQKTQWIARAHEELGHAHDEATYLFLKQCVKWERMREDIREFVKKCELCQRFGGCRKNGPIQRIRLEEPFSLIGIDLVGPLPKTDKGNRYLIVATDYLSRWAEAKAVKMKTADEVAKFILENIVSRHGVPKRILSDQGREFANKIVQRICKRLGTVKSWTSAYHPQCNGAVERLNRTLIAKLARICDGEWNQWDERLPWALYAYRISPIVRLKKSPFEIIYGRQPNVLEGKNESKEELTQNDVGQGALEALEAFRKITQEHVRTVRDAEIQGNKGGEKAKTLNVGDIVMKRRESFEMENKLDDKWSGPFRVTKNFNNGGYEIENTDSRRYRYNGKDLKLMDGTDSEEWLTFKEGSVLSSEKDNQSFMIKLI